MTALAERLGVRDMRCAAALVLLGIAIGCAGAHFYFMGFLEDRADDGQAMMINGRLYQVSEYGATNWTGLMQPYQGVRVLDRVGILNKTDNPNKRRGDLQRYIRATGI